MPSPSPRGAPATRVGAPLLLFSIAVCVAANLRGASAARADPGAAPSSMALTAAAATSSASADTRRRQTPVVGGGGRPPLLKKTAVATARLP